MEASEEDELVVMQREIDALQLPSFFETIGVAKPKELVSEGPSEGMVASDNEEVNAKATAESKRHKRTRRIVPVSLKLVPPLEEDEDDEEEDVEEEDEKENEREDEKEDDALADEEFRQLPVGVRGENTKEIGQVTAALRKLTPVSRHKLQLELERKLAKKQPLPLPMSRKKWWWLRCWTVLAALLIGGLLALLFGGWLNLLVGPEPEPKSEPAPTVVPKAVPTATVTTTIPPKPVIEPKPVVTSTQPKPTATQTQPSPQPTSSAGSLFHDYEE